MCTDGGQAPGSIAEALRMTGAGLDYLNSPAAANLHATAAGEILTALGVIGAKFTAAHATFLRRFDAADAHDADGYGTSAAWLAARTQLSVKDAKAAVWRMRRFAERPRLQLAQRGQHRAAGGGIQLSSGGGVEVVQARARHAQRLGDAAGRLVAVGAHPGSPPRGAAAGYRMSCRPSAPSAGLITNLAHPF